MYVLLTIWTGWINHNADGDFKTTKKSGSNVSYLLIVVGMSETSDRIDIVVKTNVINISILVLLLVLPLLILNMTLPSP